ncbi:MAG: hypothetical protein WCZ23_09265 [Rhodospirillaceae bacterium]
MSHRGTPLFDHREPALDSVTVTHRGFVRWQIGTVVVLFLFGLVFTLYPTLAGMTFDGMDGFGLAAGNAEDPDMAGAAPEGQRLKLAVFGALTLFNLNAEGSFATWWSSFNLGLAAVLAFLVSLRVGRASRFQGILWRGLAVVMLLLCIDEVAQVHDRINKAQFVLGVLFESLPSRPWVIIGGAFALLVGLASIPLLLALPRRVAAQIVLAGAAFVLGAVGLEVLAAELESAGASLYSLPVMTLILIEETLEMGAIALFNIVLFTRLVPPGLSVRFPETRVPAPVLQAARQRDAAE